MDTDTIKKGGLYTSQKYDSALHSRARPLHSKSKRPQRRKRVTLIAAFRCETNGHKGVAICADSQETYGDYRVAVDKIKPRDAGHYDLIVGGAGNIAALIDGLSNAIEQNVKRWSAKLDEDEARLKIERVLLSYYTRQVEHYPAEQHEKVLRFIICTRDKETGQVYLWKTDGTTAERVEDYALLGWEEAVYDYEVKWLYRRGLGIMQAVLLGIHLLTIAKSSLYVGGDTQVIVAHEFGVMVEDTNEVRSFEQRIDSFNTSIARLILACPDTSIEPEDFRALLLDFMEKAVQLHDEYCVDAAVKSLLLYGLHEHTRPLLIESYLKMPVLSMLREAKRAMEAIESGQVPEEYKVSMDEARARLQDKAKKFNITLNFDDEPDGKE